MGETPGLLWKRPRRAVSDKPLAYCFGPSTGAPGPPTTTYPAGGLPVSSYNAAALVAANVTAAIEAALWSWGTTTVLVQ